LFVIIIFLFLLNLDVFAALTIWVMEQHAFLDRLLFVNVP